MKNFIKKYRVLLSAILFSLALWSMAMLAIQKSYNQSVSNHIDNKIQLMDSMIRSTTESFEEFSSFYYESFINQPPVLEIMAEANDAETSRKDQLRAELYNSLEEDYTLLKQYDFRQLHFHLKNGDSFLRFHAPDQYGDNLFEVRDSIRIANTEHRYVFGFEEGRVFSGYRFVYPLSLDGKSVGSVEVSISLCAVIKTLKNIYPTSNFLFLLKREAVEKTVFLENQDNYLTSSLFEDYLIDKEMIEIILNTDNEKKLYQDKNFLDLVRKKASVQIGQNQPFGFGVEYQGKDYLIRFQPINNISGVTVGYYVSASEDEVFSILKNQRAINSLLITVLILLVTVSFAVLNRNRMKIQTMAVTDKLTGAYNRHYFVSHSEQELSRSRRYHRDFCILILDIDHFKKVNDQFGHLGGDSVLIELTKLIEKTLRSTDLFARWGGEEFIILLPESNIEQGYLVAERLRSAVEVTPFHSAGKITVSLGISSLIINDQSVDEIIRRADNALYEAKESGRNKVVTRQNLDTEKP